MSALTKKEMLDTFKNWDEKDLFCPDCLNVLSELDEKLFCPNEICMNETNYNLKGVEE